jgi:hypothetical protein
MDQSTPDELVRLADQARVLVRRAPTGRDSFLDKLIGRRELVVQG